MRLYVIYDTIHDLIQIGGCLLTRRSLTDPPTMQAKPRVSPAQHIHTCKPANCHWDENNLNRTVRQHLACSLWLRKGQQNKSPATPRLCGAKLWTFQSDNHPMKHQIGVEGVKTMGKHNSNSPISYMACIICGGSKGYLNPTGLCGCQYNKRVINLCWE